MNEEILAAGQKPFGAALLIGVHFGRSNRHDVEDHLEELASLVATLDVPVVHREIVRIAKHSSQFLIGKGKMEEIHATAEAMGVDLIVFDDDLAPPQQHLWESRTKIAVIDRRKVIIDIFAQRARTKEARLQIELARLIYTLPRLKRAWTHLERQRGGAGFVGGAGEAQIETDRRIVRDRIARLKREVSQVRQHREVQRKARGARPVPTAALVGYTNSGKSSLLNAMTGAGVLQEDKLFATLDPTTRRLLLPSNQPLLLTDTVGFIRKLPHNLVDAFQATLEEATMADFIIHVVDASHPAAADQVRVTNEVLKDLGADETPQIFVLNKMDRVRELGELNPALREMAATDLIVETSATLGEGLEELAGLLAGLIEPSLADLHLCVPTSRFDVVSAVHRDGEVLEERFEPEAVYIHARFPAKLASRMSAFATTPW